MGKEITSTSRKNSKYIYRFICSALLTSIASVAFLYRWIPFIHANEWALQRSSLRGLGNIGMSAGIYLLLYVFIGRWLRAFSIGVERKSNMLASQVLTLATVDFFEILVSCAIIGQFRLFFQLAGIYSKMFFVQAIVCGFILLPMIDLYRKFFPPLQIIEITAGADNNLADKVNGVYHKYHVIDSISVDEDESIIVKKIAKYDAVLLNDLPAHKENRMIKLCFGEDKRVYFVPKLSAILVRNSEELNLIDSPVFMNRNNGIGPIKRFIKRAFDMILSFIAIVMLSPIMIITALAIHLEDGGPVFYRQERVTIGGKRFMILKFRSMIVNAEADGKPHPAEQNDSRITRVGNIIRKIRVDELPQFFNILAGDMSIVGPRPERYEHVEMYTQQIPEFKYRLKMKGGLTGYAQVYGKYNTSALDKLKLDLIYITNYSLLLDIQIIFETIKILLQKDSTEGFKK